VTIFIVWTEY